MPRFGRRRAYYGRRRRYRRRGTGFPIRWVGPLASVGLTVILIGVFTVMPAMQHGGTSYIATDLNASDIEHHIHLYTNEQRTYGGLHPLERIRAIDGIARGHSEDMVERRFFSHYNLEGLDQTARGEMAGYRCLKATHHGMAENIFQHNEMGRYDTSEDAARDTVSWWMDSPGHRANIMDPAYDRIGVGVAMDDRGTVYATQNFC